MKKLFTLIFLVASFAAFSQQAVTIVPLNAKIVFQSSPITSTVWSFDSGVGGKITNPNQLSTTATLPAGVFSIRITVKDNMGNTVYKVRRINVVDNRAPIIDAGPADTTIYLGSTSAVLQPKDENMVDNKLKLINDVAIIYYNSSQLLADKYISLPVGEIKE